MAHKNLKGGELTCDRCSEVFKWLADADTREGPEWEQMFEEADKWLTLMLATPPKTLSSPLNRFMLRHKDGSASLDGRIDLCPKCAALFITFMNPTP